MPIVPGYVRRIGRMSRGARDQFFQLIRHFCIPHDPNDSSSILDPTPTLPKMLRNAFWRGRPPLGSDSSPKIAGYAILGEAQEGVVLPEWIIVYQFLGFSWNRCARDLPLRDKDGVEAGLQTVVGDRSPHLTDCPVAPETCPFDKYLCTLLWYTFFAFCSSRKAYAAALCHQPGQILRPE
jgi:hypothetical protein